MAQGIDVASVLAGSQFAGFKSQMNSCEELSGALLFAQNVQYFYLHYFSGQRCSRCAQADSVRDGAFH